MTPWQNKHVFVRFFQISASVVVKHVQSIEITKAFCLPGGHKKLLGCGLLGGSVLRLTLWLP